MYRRFACCFVTAWLLWCSYGLGQSTEPKSDSHPASTAIEHLVQAAIDEHKLPGCVIAFGNSQQVEFLQAYGDRQLEPQRETMTTDTVFDLASLTKPVATATSIMKLVENKQLSLSDRVAEHLPAFGTNGKEEITVEQMLLHQSGLIADNPLADYQAGREEAWDRIYKLELSNPVDSKFVYSDVNFIVLGRLVEQLSGLELQQFTQQHLFQPLGMSETGFVPEASLRTRAATTQQREERWMRGEVHDPRAYLLGGVAGHAGLFSTASDLALYAQMMLKGGEVRTVDGELQKVLEAETIRTMTRAYPVSSGIRGLGWDKQTGYSSNRGTKLGEPAFGHGGFTGTVLWMDPSQDLFFIFLSNRVHPDGKGSVNQLAGTILDAIVEHREIANE